MKLIQLFTILLLELTSSEGLKVIARNRTHCILFYKEGLVLFSPSQHKVYIWNETNVLQAVIGCDKEVNLDSKASHYKLHHPIGICIEFNNIVDYRLSYIKLVSTMIHIATSFSAIRKLMQAFSIHVKKGEMFFLQRS